MATWTISTNLWHTITAEVRATETSTQRAHSDWSQHKRNIANGFAWIEITQGEHRFAPQRHAPGIKRGTAADPGLAIDRAWWRLRNGKAGQHYWDLRAALTHTSTISPLRSTRAGRPPTNVQNRRQLSRKVTLGDVLIVSGPTEKIERLGERGAFPR